MEKNIKTLICLVLLTVQHEEKNDNEDESDEEEIPNDAEMESHGTEDDLEIQIDDNLESSRSFELNNIDNIDVGASSSTNVHNIGVGTSSDTNNPLDAKKFLTILQFHDPFLRFEFILYFSCRVKNIFLTTLLG